MATHPIHPPQNHGTLQGATPCDDRIGQPGKALLFDGIDDQIVASYQSSISSSSFSYSLWAKPTSSTSTYGGVITFRETFKGYNLYKHQDNSWSFGSVTVLVLGKPYKVRPLAYHGLHLPSLVMVPTSRRFRTEL